MSDPNISLFAAMADAFAELEPVAKDAANPHFRSRYASLAAVTEAVRPPLSKHGLFFIQETADSEKGVTVETVIGHRGGGRMACGKLFVPATKQDAQGYGSALTYARRYSLMTALGIPAEDDDGNAAVASHRRAPANDSNGKISDAQKDELIALIAAANASTDAFLDYLGIARLDHLPASRFGDAKAALDQKIKQNGREAARG